jgi:hypothetical protein
LKRSSAPPSFAKTWALLQLDFETRPSSNCRSVVMRLRSPASLLDHPILPLLHLQKRCVKNIHDFWHCTTLLLHEELDREVSTRHRSRNIYVTDSSMFRRTDPELFQGLLPSPFSFRETRSANSKSPRSCCCFVPKRHSQQMCHATPTMWLVRWKRRLSAGIFGVYSYKSIIRSVSVVVVVDSSAAINCARSCSLFDRWTKFLGRKHHCCCDEEKHCDFYVHYDFCG